MRFVRDTRNGQPQRAQGTVVGTPDIGTINGPKQAPTATQYGGGDSIPNTQSTLTQERGWPPNPGWLISSPSGSRAEQARLDYLLQVSTPPPARVLRGLFARIFGKVGEEVSSFPFNGDMSTIPHIAVPRNAMRTGPYARVYDDSAPIPAVYAGNARR